MPHTLWKGAISFGLVHIPVALYPASHDDAIDFDWLDRRSMDPVGYKRINKRTGKEVGREDIVKGVKVEDDRYVVVSDEEIRQAYPRTTQTIEIDAFVQASDIPFVYLDRPYYLSPIGKGEKVYVLLRETLLAASRVGIARVVIQTKEHLAALIPAGPALMLNTLRWPQEIRSWEDLKLPATGGKAAGLSAREMKMAAQLVGDMAARFDAARYTDTFRDAVMALVASKARQGQSTSVAPLENAGEATPSNIVDLTELLRRSLGRRGGGAGGDHEAAKAPVSKAASVRKRARGTAKSAVKSPRVRASKDAEKPRRRA